MTALPSFEIIADREPSSLQIEKLSATQFISGIQVFQAGWFHAMEQYAPHIKVATISSDPHLNVDRMRAFLNQNSHLLCSLSIDFRGLLQIRDCAPEMAVLPITGFVHGTAGEYFRELLGWSLLRGLGRHDAIVCSSLAGKKVLQSIFDELHQELIVDRDSVPQLPLIPLGIDVEHEFPTRPVCSVVRLLSLGRLAWFTKADPSVLIVICKMLGDDLPFEMVIAGSTSGSQEKWESVLYDLARSYGVSHRLRVVTDPSHGEKQRLFQECDIFLSLSDNLSETFGLTLLEAGAAGMPVVASDWNGYRDIVVNGETGYLAETSWCDLGPWFGGFGMPPFSPLSAATIVNLRQVTEYLRALITNVDLRRQMGEQARNRILSEFSWPVIIERQVTLFGELVRDYPSKSAKGVRKPRVPAYKFQDLFKHFPSHHLADSAILAPGPMFGDATALYSPGKEMHPFIDVAILETITSYVEATGPASMSNIVDSLSALGLYSSETLRYHVSRLLKLYVLEQTPRQPGK